VELEPQAIEVLERAGLRKGQIVLDFGCGSGTYTIPAARTVGGQGKVYALDKDKEALDEVMRKARSAGLKNVERMETSGKLEIDLPDGSVDVVLLFDVFHDYYFPARGDRRRLLDEIYRVMKPSAFMSVSPKHMESEAEGEIENANFYLEKVLPGALIHNKTLEWGNILNFRKGLKNKNER